jgi:hypothetical protein
MSKVAGTLSSIVMTIPLLAVPCLAIFGLPSFGPAVAEAETDTAVQLADGGGSLGQPAAPAAGSDPFAPIVDAAGAASAPNSIGSGTAAGQPHLDETSDHRYAGANRAIGLEETRVAVAPAAPPAAKSTDEPLKTPFRRVDDEPPAAPEAKAAASGSWETAVAKLGALGASDVRAATGEVPGEFYCTCTLREGGRVTRRFESEAATKAAAAADLLAQVEACRDAR